MKICWTFSWESAGTTHLMLDGIDSMKMDQPQQQLKVNVSFLNEILCVVDVAPKMSLNWTEIIDSIEIHTSRKQNFTIKNLKWDPVDIYGSC